MGVRLGHPNQNKVFHGCYERIVELFDPKRSLFELEPIFFYLISFPEQYLIEANNETSIYVCPSVHNQT